MQIKTLDQLDKCAHDRKAVAIKEPYGLCSKPMPAIFLMNMNGSIILSRIRAGLFVYKSPKKIKPKYFRPVPNQIRKGDSI